jgi:hypothetical protein
MSRKPFEITLDLPNSEGREKNTETRKKKSFLSLLSRPDLLLLMYYSTTATRFEFRSSRESKLQALESTAKTPPLAKTQRKLVPPLQQLQLLEMVLRKLCWLSNGKLYCDSNSSRDIRAFLERGETLLLCICRNSHLGTDVTEAAANLPFLFSFLAEFRQKEKLKN